MMRIQATAPGHSCVREKQGAPIEKKLRSLAVQNLSRAAAPPQRAAPRQERVVPLAPGRAVLRVAKEPRQHLLGERQFGRLLQVEKHAARDPPRGDRVPRGGAQGEHPGDAVLDPAIL